MQRYILIFFITVLMLPLQAQEQLSENARISIFTCSPWAEEIYARFGHTAVRVKDDSLGINIVFNYGHFDMSKPNFMLNFTRGHTDYYVGAEFFESFIYRYALQGVEVVEQVLNLTQEETQNLFNAMYINTLPENREYRYNFFFDNCVTRPRDLIEKYIQGTSQYPADKKVQTFRDLLHECTSLYPWFRFGIDLVIGSDADKPITLREKMFLPVYFQNALEETTVTRNGIISPILKETNIILYIENEEDNRSERSLFSPIVIAFAILFLSIVISLMQRRKANARLPKIFDTILFFVAGICGLIVFFLMFFSVHPATNPNWNIVWINPLMLIFAFLFWVKPLRSIIYCYHFINFAVLTLFLLLWWFIPQQLPLATIPFSMCLWLRSGTNWFLWRKGRK
jgi:hypothetical protein